MASFFVVWAGQACSLLGSSLVQFALIWYLTVSTGSATVLAVASLVGFVPQVLVGPFAGALVDRWSRRVVMIVVDVAIALATTVLALLFAFGLVAIWQIYALLLVRSLGAAFHWPAMLATTTLMVPKRHLSRVAGLNQALQGVSGIVVPPAGALLLALLPLSAILAIDVVTALLAIGPLIFVFIPEPEAAAAPDASPPGVRGGLAVLTEVREGLGYLWSWPGLLMIALMGVLIRLLLSPGVALLPILVSAHFGGGPLELGSLQAAMGIGMVAGGLLLSVWGGFRRRVVTAMLALTLDGVAILALGLAPGDRFALALGALLVAGVVEPLVHGPLGAVAQATIPPSMQGRVFGLVGASSSAAALIGLAMAGPLADTVGVQFWFVAGGVATAAMGAGAFLVPAIMRVEEGKPETGERGRAAAAARD